MVLPHRLRELLKISEQPEMIFFAGGLPAAEVFALQRIAELLVSRALSGSACTSSHKALEKTGFLPLTGCEVLVNGLRRATSSGHGQNYSGSPGDDVAARKNAFAGSALGDWRAFTQRRGCHAAPGTHCNEGREVPCATNHVVQVMFTLDGVLADIEGSDAGMAFSISRHVAEHWLRHRNAFRSPLMSRDLIRLQSSVLLYTTRLWLKCEQALLNRLLPAGGDLITRTSLITNPGWHRSKPFPPLVG